MSTANTTPLTFGRAVGHAGDRLRLVIAAVSLQVEVVVLLRIKVPHPESRAVDATLRTVSERPFWPRSQPVYVNTLFTLL